MNTLLRQDTENQKKGGKTLEKLKKLKKLNKNNSGITLIALVITIIVLLILAGISINMLSGNNSILNRASDAKVQSAIAAKKEEVQMAIAAVLTDNEGNEDKVTISQVVEEVKKNYSRQSEKNSIVGEATGEKENRFPGTITYNKPSSGIGKAIVVTIDEGLGTTAETEEPDQFSNLEKVTPSESKYTSISGVYCNSPDLSGFKADSTYYVTYDSNGTNERIAGRIDRIEANGNKVGEGTNNVWYDYGNKVWANIVTVSGNDVTYWTWIPRYKYKENSGSTQVEFIDNNGVCYKDVNGVKTPVDVSSLELADSFKFGDKELSGYWLSKYEVQAEPGNEKIYVTTNGKKRTVTTTNPSGTYTVYVEGIEQAKGATLPYTINGLKAGKKYDICVVSETNKKMIGRTGSSADNIEVDTSGFDKESTYYVTYDQNGNNETIAGRMDKMAPPENWYNYNNRIWANLVTVSGNDVTYWTYVPRYECIQGTGSSTTDVHFISTSKTTPSQYYEIPESFTFNGKQLKGYWLSKQEVQDSGSSGIEKVTYSKNGNNVSVTTDNISGTYTIFLNGEKVKTGETLPCTLKVDDGNFNIVVVSEEKNRVVGSTKGSTDNIQVDLSGFDKNNTYYVLYDSNGNEVSSDIKVDYDENGNPTNVPDESTGIWYDYRRKIWANVVTKANNEIAYWTYIPRYEHVEGGTSGLTGVHFIPVTQTTPRTGYQIPESFTFGTKQLKGYWLSKYEVQD